MNAIEFKQVWKKFNKGEKFNSLRDAIPNFFHNAIFNNKLKENEFWALQDVSFEIKKGEVVGIIGPNGAGKSTILKLLSRILSPNKGEAKIKGRLSALIEVTAGFHPDLTGRENVYLNGTILGMRKKEIEAKFDEIVEFSGVEEFIDTPVKRYSSGMCARLGFSVAAHMDPEVMLVDEVLAVGDLNFQSKCTQKMRSLLNSGTTIVLVSHNLTLVQNICKRVILLDKGVIVKTGEPDETVVYYQNSVYENMERELMKKTEPRDHKVHFHEDSLVKISKAVFYNDEQQVKNSFKFSEPISIRIAYETKERIEDPVFVLELIRGDGVNCCTVDTKTDGHIIKSISGRGEININLGRINLSPGIYSATFYISEKDMTHAFAIGEDTIFKIEPKANISSDPIFHPDVKWRMKQ